MASYNFTEKELAMLRMNDEERQVIKNVIEAYYRQGIITQFYDEILEMILSLHKEDIIRSFE